MSQTRRTQVETSPLNRKAASNTITMLTLPAHSRHMSARSQHTPARSQHTCTETLCRTASPRLPCRHTVGTCQHAVSTQTRVVETLSPCYISPYRPWSTQAASSISRTGARVQDTAKHVSNLDFKCGRTYTFETSHVDRLPVVIIIHTGIGMVEHTRNSGSVHQMQLRSL